MTTYVFLVWQTYCFFHISANNFLLNDHEVLSDSLKYFILVLHMCTLTFMIP